MFIISLVTNNMFISTMESYRVYLKVTTELINLIKKKTQDKSHKRCVCSSKN